MFSSKTVGERIRLLRKKKGMTQSELGKKLQVSPTSIQRIEYGHNFPTFDKIVELSMFFNVTSDYLLGLTDLNDLETKDKKKTVAEGKECVEIIISSDLYEKIKSIADSELRTANNQIEYFLHKGVEKYD